MRFKAVAALLLGAVLPLLVLFLLPEPSPQRPAAGDAAAVSGTVQIPPTTAAAPVVNPSPDLPVLKPAEDKLEPAEQPVVPAVTGRAFLHDRHHPLRFATLSYAEVLESSHSDWKKIKTGDDGRFSADISERGEVALTFRHRSYEPLTFDLRLPSSPAEELELIFTSGIMVTGTAKNRAGTVLPGAQISWERVGERKIPAWQCSTDMEGRYRQGDHLF